MAHSEAHMTINKEAVGSNLSSAFLFPLQASIKIYCNTKRDKNGDNFIIFSPHFRPWSCSVFLTDALDAPSIFG